MLPPKPGIWRMDTMACMNNIPERGAANALRIFFGILMFFTVAVFLNCIVIHSTLLNNTFWKETLLGEDLRQTVKEEISDKITGVAGDSEAVRKGIEAADDIVDYALDEFAGIIVDGNTKIDPEGLDKFIDKYGDDISKVTGVSKKDMKDAKDDAYDQINDVLGEVSKSTGDGKRLVPELIDVEGYKKANNTAMILSAVATLLMMTVLLIIHRNRFRPVRTFGIVTASAAVACVILWLIISAKFRSGDVFGKNAFADMFVNAALKSVSKIYIVFAAAFAAGVLLIIAGAAGVSLVKRRRQKINHI